MKKIFTLLTLLISLCLTSETIASNNQVVAKGIDLEEYSFGIPANQLGFNASSEFTLSFWVNVKEFNHSEYGTNFVNIRDVSQGWPMSDWGYMWSQIGKSEYQSDNFERKIEVSIKDRADMPHISEELSLFEFNESEWKYISFVFDYNQFRSLTLYIDGVATYVIDAVPSDYIWKSNYNIMIGGVSALRAPLNAYIDKVQFYNKALSEAEVKESMIAPLNDASLLGYWDFENGCTTDSEGYMMADKGTIKATMYNILQTEEGISNGTEIKPFTFGEGVNPESVLQGIEESATEESNTKAYVSDGVLYIESAKDKNSVTVYDAMGRIITSGTYSNASLQIPLPTTLKGVVMVKVDNCVVKVVCN